MFPDPVVPSPGLVQALCGGNPRGDPRQHIIAYPSSPKMCELRLRYEAAHHYEKVSSESRRDK